MEAAPHPWRLVPALVSTGAAAPLASLCFGAAGVVASSLWYWLPVRRMLAERLTSSLELISRDASFEWIKLWLDQQAGECRHMSVETVINNDEEEFFAQRQTTFFPSVGWHVVRFRGRRIFVHRERHPNTDLNNGGWMEVIRLVVWSPFRSDLRFLRELVDQAKRVAISHDRSKTVIYTAAGGSHWARFGQPRTIRPLESVVLADGVAAHVLADLADFLKAHQWYRDRGIPYRRGYLLYGAPGCGKTSFIKALAGHHQLDICICNLNDEGITDESLNALLNDAKPGSIILLEDVDSAFDCSSRDQPRAGRLSMSGLLNAIDGVASQEGRILFMTTNRRAVLDPALVRRGRIDVEVEIGLATRPQIRRMFLNFYGASNIAVPGPLLEATLDQLPERSFSMADLQAHLLNQKADPAEALRTLGALCAPPPRPPSR